MYEEARRKGAKGWSTMNRAQLELAVGRWSSEEADDRVASIVVTFTHGEPMPLRRTGH
jgi:hypothetical protein